VWRLAGRGVCGDWLREECVCVCVCVCVWRLAERVVRECVWRVADRVVCVCVCDDWQRG